MSLLPFHKLLISVAIVFCFGFAIYEVVGFADDGGTSRLVVAFGFLVAGGALVYYLRNLERFLKL